MSGRYWLETLGCPKNQVDSEKLARVLQDDGLRAAERVEDADLVVVNTCAFIQAAREESVEAILSLDDARHHSARLVVTGCMAERHGPELAEALPEVDLVAGFGVPVTMGAKRSAAPRLDLLNLPRPAPSAPWAYVKVAEGCDRACGFCDIPSFRGRQRSRSPQAVLEEVDALVGGGVAEVVLVAQDLASYGRDDPALGTGSVVPLVHAVAERVARTRLLYLYPSDLSDALVDAIGGTGVAYFDLSLQHASGPLLRRMRRWGDGERFMRRIDRIRARWPDAAFRSNFIVGYPGETESDHEALLAFLEAAQLDWCGFFTYSREEGTYAAGLDGEVSAGMAQERLREASELQDAVTAGRREALVGHKVEVLVDTPGVGRTHREAPEIDGIVRVPDRLAVGSFADVLVTAAEGPDVFAEAV